MSSPLARLASARLGAAVAALLVLAAPAASQAPSPEDDEVPRLAPVEVAAYLAETPGAQILDVRRPAEVALSGRLAEATVIDVSVPGFERRATDLLDPERPVVVYCRSGGRAGRAAEILAGLGFGPLVNAGGFAALADAGLPTASP
ncbi:MAG: rhodanese-like domain-containing protein [Bacteroidota bacterium]